MKRFTYGVVGGYVSESFLSGSLDHLVWKLEIIVEDMQII